MYKTEGNGSCWPIAVLREWGVVSMNDSPDSAFQKIQGVLGPKFAKFQRWAE
jgi:hypothetical protein